MRTAATIAVVACAVFTHGCFLSRRQPGPADPGPEDAGTMSDMAFITDAGPDLGPSDLGVDAGLPDAGPADAGLDLGPDLGPCGGPCVPSGPCVVASCDEDTGMCVEATRDDGAVCDELGEAICVYGECVTRGCGDGYREPGSVEWPREGCDDGNAVVDDACSGMCEPLEYIADVDLGEDPENEYDTTIPAGAQLLAVDGLGYGLFVWAQDYFGALELRGMRFDRFGAPLDAPGGFVIEADLPENAGPSVVGLSRGGFVVAYAATRIRNMDIVLVPVSLEGVVGSERIANVQTHADQMNPALAALSDSFVVVWEERRLTIAGDPEGGLRARRFRESMAPLSEEIVVQSNNAGVQVEPTVAARLDALGHRTDEWMVAFTVSETAFSQQYIHARRFLNSGGLGSEFEVHPGSAYSPTITALPGTAGDYVVAWVHGEVDALGDIEARTVPGATAGVFGDIVTVASESGTAERDPIVVPYGPAGLGGYLVAYRRGSPTGMPAYSVVDAMLPTEATIPDLGSGDGPLVAAAGPRTSGGSVWLSYAGYPGIPSAGVAAWLFLLPPS